MSYGSVGGARGVAQLRQITAALKLATVATAIHVPLPTRMAHCQSGDVEAGLAQLEVPAKAMIDDLLWWTTALKTARELG